MKLKTDSLWVPLVIFRRRQMGEKCPALCSIYTLSYEKYNEHDDVIKFPTKRPVTRSFDVFFDLRLNKQFSK